MAENSAAYKAVIELYKKGFIKTDLRPKKYEHLEEERELEKYNDIQETKKNLEYRKIFEKFVKVKIDNEERTERKFARFYFKSLMSE